VNIIELLWLKKVSTTTFIFLAKIWTILGLCIVTPRLLKDSRVTCDHMFFIDSEQGHITIFSNLDIHHVFLLKIEMNFTASLQSTHSNSVECKHLHLPAHLDFCVPVTAELHWSCVRGWVWPSKLGQKLPTTKVVTLQEKAFWHSEIPYIRMYTFDSGRN
jgi:hypothetical protein